MTSFVRFLDALRDAGCTVVEKGGDRATASAPDHSAADRSISVSYDSLEGRTVFNSFTDDREMVLNSLGLSWSDLFDTPRRGTQPSQDRVPQLTAEQIAKRDENRRRKAERDAAHRQEFERELKLAEEIAAEMNPGAPRPDWNDPLVQHPELRGGSRTGSVPAEQEKYDPGPDGLLYKQTVVVPVPDPGSGTGTTPTLATYFDMAGLLSGDLPEPPAPTVMARSDGVAIFYADAFNLVFSDPESGKTWLVLCAMAEELNKGHRVLFVDLDHNGPTSIATRLIALGVSVKVLSDLDRFRYIEPDDTVAVTEVVEDAGRWRPHLVGVDSLGELLPMFRASSNSGDDFTSVHGKVIKPLVKSGAAVVVIDHLAKGQESRASGPTGSPAKRRAVDGVSLRVKAESAFVPGQGGKAFLTINKDRHGGLRAKSDTGGREPLAAVFELIAKPDDTLAWKLRTPKAGETAPADGANADLVAKIAALDPPPKSGNAAHAALGGNRQAVLAAFKEWVHQPVPVPHPGAGTDTTCPVCRFPMTATDDINAGQHLSCQENR